METRKRARSTEQGDGDYAPTDTSSKPKKPSKAAKPKRRISDSDDEDVTADTTDTGVLRSAKRGPRNRDGFLRVVNDFIQARNIDETKLSYEAGEIKFDASWSSNSGVKEVGDSRKYTLARRALAVQRSTAVQHQTTDDALAATVSSFFEPPTGSKRFVLEVANNGDPSGKAVLYGNWEFRLHDTKTNQTVYARSCSSIEKNKARGDAILANCRQQGPLVENFLNHWDQKIGGVAALDEKSFRMLWGREMVRFVNSDKAQVTCANWESGRWNLQLKYLQSTTGMVVTHDWRCALGCELPENFPDLPSDVVLGKGQAGAPKVKELARGSDGKYVTNLPASVKKTALEKGKSPEEVRRRLLNRERWMNYVAARLYGIITTEDKLKEIIRNLEEEFEIESAEPKGPGNTHSYKPVRTPLFSLEVIYTERVMSFEVNKTIWKALGFSTHLERSKAKLPRIAIKSTDVSLAMQIMPGAVRAAVEANNPLDAWRSLAAGADQINEQLSMGIRPARQLECCAACGNDASEDQLQIDFDNRAVCASCYAVNSDRDPTPVAKMMRGVGLSLQKDFKRKHDVPRSDMEQKLYDEAYTFVKAAVDGPRYRDDYASSKMRDMPLTGSPLVATVDAGHRSWVTKAYGRIKHVVGNMATTSRGINEGKYTHLLGMIQLIADYWRETGDGSMPPAELEACMKKLLSEVQEMTAIKIKHAYFDSTTSSTQPLSEIEAQTRRDELESGKLCRTDAKAWLAMGTRLYNGNSGRITNALDDQAKAGITSTYIEICELFGHVPVYGKDGAPWPNPFEPMPADWNWYHFLRIFAGKLYQLKYGCNRWWFTTETVASIACEVIYCVHEYHHNLLHADGDRQAALKHGDFLGLPMTFNIHNPLMVSVGKRVPGKEMVSGWPPYPTSVNDRDAEACTLRIDTTFSNFFRHDYPEHQETPLKGLVFDFQTVMFNKNRKAPTGFNSKADAAAVAAWDTTDIDASFANNGFDETTLTAATEETTFDDEDGDETEDAGKLTGAVTAIEMPAKKKKKGTTVPEPEESSLQRMARENKDYDWNAGKK